MALRNPKQSNMRWIRLGLVLLEELICTSGEKKEKRGSFVIFNTRSPASWVAQWVDNRDLPSGDNQL